MPLTEVQLRDRASKLERQLALRQATLDRVKELLEKADKRIEEADDKRRWYHVLDGLEHALDEAKARVIQCELEIKRANNRIEVLRARRQEDAPTRPADGNTADGLGADGLPEGELDAVSQSGAERVLAIALDDLSKMTLDEVAQLHDEILLSADEEASAPKEAAPEPAGPEAEDEPAKKAARKPVITRRKARPIDHGGTSFTDQLRQNTLRNAIEKIRTDRINALTIEEIDCVTKAYERLTQQVSADPAQQGLRETLGKSMASLERRCAELRRKRAQMYARRRY